MKRWFDLCLVLLSAPLWLPLLGVIALLVRVKLGAPALFRQPRAGRHGQRFVLLKFRSMTAERDAQGQLLPDAQRLTAFGKFLRASSLDELPELLNVLRGEMSLVGPRPLFLEYLPYYSERHRRRHEVLPGITGLAQVAGRNRIPFSQRFELDVWYVEHQSLWLDLTLLARTVAGLVQRRGDVVAGQTVDEVDDLGLARDLPGHHFRDGKRGPPPPPSHDPTTP